MHNIAERIVAELQETVVALDLDGRIIFWNAFAEKLHGWRADEIIGLKAVEVLATSSREEGEHLLRRMRNGEMWMGEFTVHHRDGYPIKLWASGAPLRDERGEVFGIVAFAVPADAHVDAAASSTSPQRSIRTQTSGDVQAGMEQVVRMTERSLSIAQNGPYGLLAYMLQGVLREAHMQLRLTTKADHGGSDADSRRDG